MSLISTASPWISDDSNKKRTPTMRKTIKKQPDISTSFSALSPMNEPDEYMSNGGINAYSEGRRSSPEEYEKMYQDIQNEGPPQNSQEGNRQNRINELIQQMQSLNAADNDGKNLADFKPLSHPTVNNKKDNVLDTSTENLAYFPPIDIGVRQSVTPQRSTFSANNSDLDKNSDYRMVYQPPPKMTASPAYSGNVTSLPRTDEKLLDKINYMIHLLEEQANEKTNNVMEEFIMFSLVGVFLIYVLDSFSRSGKYTR